MKVPIKQAFERHLQRRYSLRLHMFVILLATTLSGILFSKILLFFDVIDFKVRYPLAVVFSYLVFFVCIKLWLAWIASVKESKTSATDWLDLTTPSFRGGTEKVLPSIHGGGGQFLGAGSSNSFDSPETALVETTVSSDLPPLGGGKSEDIREAIGEAAGALGDDNVIVAVIVLAVLVATILASTILLLYGAPAILAEAAFQGVLAASLIKRTKAISDKAWAGSILKATWKPFAVTLGVAFFGGAVLHIYFPRVVRLADILWKG
jgi:hypothetical protein